MPLSLFIYRMFTRLLGPLIYRILHYYRFKIGKESSTNYLERKGVSKQTRPNGNIIWFHAASNGEAMAALAVIKALHQHYSELKFLITSGTLTSAQLIKPDLPEYIYHQFIPYDVPQWIQRFINNWQPKLLIMIESEFWPNLIIQTAKQSIPILLLNGQLSEKSFKKWCYFRRTSQFLMEKFDLILAKLPQHQRYFKILGAPNVQLMDNIKFLSQSLPYKISDLGNLQHQIGNRPLWIAASTHDGEESIIILAHKYIKSIYPNLLTIIIPRHPMRVFNICQQFDEAEISYAIRSKNQSIVNDIEIYLADTVGELGLFYRLGNIVLLGGSLVNIGGHNLIEPALLHNVIIYGPYMHKQNDITKIFEDNNAVIKIKDDREIADTVSNLLQQPTTIQMYQSKAYKTAMDQQKIAGNLLLKLQPFIAQLIL